MGTRGIRDSAVEVKEPGIFGWEEGHLRRWQVCVGTRLRCTLGASSVGSTKRGGIVHVEIPREAISLVQPAFPSSLCKGSTRLDVSIKDPADSTAG